MGITGRMRVFGLAVPIAIGAASSALAAPQMLGVVATNTPIPMYCQSGQCSAELTTICLHERRDSPPRGFGYTVHDEGSVVVAGVRADGTMAPLPTNIGVAIAAARGHAAVRISLPQRRLAELGFTQLRVTVRDGATLVPDTMTGDAFPLTPADINEGAGALRQIAHAIVDAGGERAEATQLAARMINELPRYGRADQSKRIGLWKTISATAATALSRDGRNRARAIYMRCNRKTQLGDQTLRQCMVAAHDRLISELNEAYWQAARTGF